MHAVVCSIALLIKAAIGQRVGPRKLASVSDRLQERQPPVLGLGLHPSLMLANLPLNAADERARVQTGPLTLTDLPERLEPEIAPLRPTTPGLGRIEVVIRSVVLPARKAAAGHEVERAAPHRALQDKSFDDRWKIQHPLHLSAAVALAHIVVLGHHHHLLKRH